MRRFDLLVIGMGAGFPILDAALNLGLDCAVAEREHFGGTCLNFGCIPSKVIITPIDTVRQVEGAAKTGLVSEGLFLDWQRLYQRVRAKLDGAAKIAQIYAEEANLTMMGDVHFTGRKVLCERFPDGSEGEPFTADTIIIAAGGSVNIPPIEGLEQVSYFTPKIFFQKKFPKEAPGRVLIVGGGAIGTEFAHFFAGAGSDVSILQRNVRLAPLLDEELSLALKEGLESLGVKLYLGTDIMSAGQDEGGLITVELKDRAGGESFTVEGDMLFLATGIRSNARDLGAAACGLSLDNRGYIRTNEFLETNVEGVYALGDINGLAQFRHKANYEAEIIEHNLFTRKEGQRRRRAKYAGVPSCIFSYPQVASVGLTEKQAGEQGYELKIGRFMLSDVIKGYALGLEESAKDGFVKMVVDAKTDRILGVHVAGHEAALLVQPYVYLMQAGYRTHEIHNEDIASPETLQDRKLEPEYIDPMSVRLINESMIIHPALSEAAGWVTSELVPADEYEPLLP